MMKARDYVTNKRTGTIHLMSQSPVSETTLCGELVSILTHEWGDETISGVSATCETCKRKAQVAR